MFVKRLSSSKAMRAALHLYQDHIDKLFSALKEIVETDVTKKFAI